MTADFGGLRMKHLKRCIALICALCMVLGLLSGCGNEQTTETYQSASEYTNVESGVVAENSRYRMNWNAERAAVTVTDKATGAVWGTTPNDYLNKTTRDNIVGNELINSSMVVRCRKSAKQGQQEFDYTVSDQSITRDTYLSEKTENGINITYYLDEIEAIVTAEYYLEDDAFKVKVDPQKIKSYGENLVIAVTPAPFMCSAANTPAGSKDSYLVVPSGSGALMYTDRRSDGVIRNFSADFYGADYAVDVYVKDQNANALTMPFFGVKVGGNALCAVVEQGAESSSLQGAVGSGELGYSYLDVQYNVTAHNKVYTTGNYRTQYDTAISSEINPLIIGYRSLGSSDASYTGIAKCYRTYLIEKQGMTKSQDNTLLTTRFVGTAKEDDLFLGLPTSKAVALTSYEEAQTILGELSSLTGGKVAAQMYAYGKGGINGTKLAGGYSLTGVAGSKKQLKSFVEYVNSNSIKTYFDFNTVLFAKSTAGYKTNWDSAINLNGAQATVRQFNISTRGRKTSKEGGVTSVMIKRNLLSEATLKTVDLADDFGFTGLSFNTLGSMCYADYSDDGNSPLRNNMGQDVANIIAEVRKNSKTVMIDGALSYAAAAADVLTNCPTDSSELLVLDDTVPLYQIVFQGTKANSVSPINTAVNPRKQFLKAIETGSGLSFNLVANYNTELRKQREPGLQSSLYSDNKAKIEGYVKESADYLAKVAGAKIVNHQMLSQKVTKTVFENGVTVYVNYGETSFTCEAGTVQPLGFTVK